MEIAELHILASNISTISSSSPNIMRVEILTTLPASRCLMSWAYLSLGSTTRLGVSVTHKSGVFVHNVNTGLAIHRFDKHGRLGVVEMVGYQARHRMHQRVHG